MNRPITTEETYHVSNILEHYAHAKVKHPYFCDGILSPVEDYKGALDNQRSRLAAAKSCGMVAACDLIDRELLEAYVEAANGNNVHAVEECYNCIAILLRTIDVLEGRQKLGKPETRQRVARRTVRPPCTTREAVGL